MSVIGGLWDCVTDLWSCILRILGIIILVVVIIVGLGICAFCIYKSHDRRQLGKEIARANNASQAKAAQDFYV